MTTYKVGEIYTCISEYAEDCLGEATGLPPICDNCHTAIDKHMKENGCECDNCLPVTGEYDGTLYETNCYICLNNSIFNDDDARQCYKCYKLVCISHAFFDEGDLLCNTCLNGTKKREMRGPPGFEERLPEILRKMKAKHTDE